MNRNIISWFTEYTNLVTNYYGCKVQNWLVLNEPIAFPSLEFYLGIHAPGLRSVNNFFHSASYYYVLGRYQTLQE